MTDLQLVAAGITTEEALPTCLLRLFPLTAGIVSAGFVFFALGMVLTQSFNGAGDTWTPTIINLFVFWLWQIPLAYLLARHTGLGAQGVFAALAIAYSTLAVVSAVVFRRGKWKHKVV